MKKLFSVILAVLMICSVFCFGAYAEGETEIVPLEVLSVDYMSDTLLYLNWSGKVDNIYDPNGDRGDNWRGWCSECGIAIVNNTTDWEIQKLGDEPMVWNGKMDYPNGWASGDIMSFEILTEMAGINTIHDAMKLVRAGGKFEGCTVAWFIKEVNTYTGGNGLVDIYFEQVADWSVPDLVINYLGANYNAPDYDQSDMYFVALEDVYLAEETTKEEKTTKADETTKKDETTKADVTTSADTTPAEEEKSSFPIIPVVIGAVALVAVVVVVIIISKKKK